MEEIEILSWLTLDAIKNASEAAETVGNLQTGHYASIFCKIEDDYLELFYSDSGANYLRRFEDKDEFDLAIEKRKEEEGEASYPENHGYEESYEEEEESKNEFDFDDSDNF